ncbi:MAG TPA: type II toxin-antitoxin system RelE/ParE family toxin [Candidatus Saccharimonadales bacterium]|nr:type II toxin-antitoxin system RelE/ParE family toxin [Candidatus Saccharimonadales bacterium]
MGELKVEFYERPSGRMPTKKALEKIQRTSRELYEATLEAVLELVDIETLSSNKVEKVGQKLWCLRIRCNKAWSRIFFTIKNGIVWLLNGFVKKSNRIPKRDLKTAIILTKEVQYVG